MSTRPAAPPVRLTLVPPDSAAPPDGGTTAGVASDPPDRAGEAQDGVPDGAPREEPRVAPQTLVLRADGEHVVIEAAQRLTLRVGASSLTLDADGTILLHGVRVTVAADEALDAVSAGAHTVRGAAVHIN